MGIVSGYRHVLIPGLHALYKNQASSFHVIDVGQEVHEDGGEEQAGGQKKTVVGVGQSWAEGSESAILQNKNVVGQSRAEGSEETSTRI